MYILLSLIFILILKSVHITPSWLSHLDVYIETYLFFFLLFILFLFNFYFTFTNTEYQRFISIPAVYKHTTSFRSCTFSRYPI